MKYLRWAASWLLYWVGHVAFLFIDRVIPDRGGEPGPVFNAGYHLYQWAMARSDQIQVGDLGPWRAADQPGERRDSSE